MNKWKAGLILLLAAAFLAGCSGSVAGDGSLTVAPYELSEEEKILISKTGIDGIEYFHLDGTLSEGEDLQFSLEIYEDGQLQEDHAYSHGEVEKEFNQSLISYGYNKEKNEIDFLNGIVNGLLEMQYESEGTDVWGFTPLLKDKASLVKDQALYIAVWHGTKGNELQTMGVNEAGELSHRMKEGETAYVFKITLTDKDKE